MRPTDSTPTPREALSHLCWALTHGENADEDVRVLSAALEQLEWLRKQAEVFQDCNTGLARERDALRAENAALKKRRQGRVGLDVVEVRQDLCSACKREWDPDTYEDGTVHCGWCGAALQPLPDPPVLP